MLMTLLIVVGGVVAFLLVYLAFAACGINIVDRDKNTRERP